MLHEPLSVNFVVGAVLVLGGSISASEWKGKGYWNLDPNLVDFNNWRGHATMPDWGQAQSLIDDTVRQTGAYATTRLNLADDLKVLLGARLVNYQVTGYNPSYRESGRVVPYIGAVYDLNDTYALYASYTDIFMPQENYNRARKSPRTNNACISRLLTANEKPSKT